MQKANFEDLNEKLHTHLETHSPATHINHREEIDVATKLFISIIKEVIQEIPLSKPSPYAKRWWTKELTELKKEKNRISNLSYKQHGILDAPIHAMHKDTTRKLSCRIDEVKKEHWTNWLEEALPRDIYTANNYITSAPSDYANTRIPSLKRSNPTSTNTTTDSNPRKVTELTAAFFPPPPNCPSIPPTAYPKPLKTHGYFTHKDIHRTVSKLKPYKAPGIDGIQNIVLQKCINTIIDHLYFLFRAILEHNAYPTSWLSSLTIVLHKPGKTSYDVAKAYRPIGLLITICKLFSTLVATDLSFITEKHLLLPPTQFGGRPSHCTTNAMHLVTSKIKDAWRAGKVASALFLDIQATFPNTVKEWLLHNMKSHRVPTCYIHLFDNMLSNRNTRLRFDDYICDPILIRNGTTQGCPLSMILYAYYNTDLIDIARGKHEPSTGFVDDCAFVATADTLDETHSILNNMMERVNGGLKWSLAHNSPFELSKLAVMDFPRTSRDAASSPLHINKMDPQGVITPYTISKVDTYKYLGVTFDPKLSWRAHTNSVTTKAIRWTQQLWRLAKASGGLPPARARQLYNTVVIPALTYASDIWYVPPFKLVHSKNS